MSLAGQQNLFNRNHISKKPHLKYLQLSPKLNSIIWNDYKNYENYDKMY
jgi:hypothetical protein